MYKVEGNAVVILDKTMAKKTHYNISVRCRDRVPTTHVRQSSRLVCKRMIKDVISKTEGAFK